MSMLQDVTRLISLADVNSSACTSTCEEEASIFQEEVVIVPLALISWTEPLKQLALLPKLRRSTALPQAIQAHEAVHEARVNVLS